MQLTDASGGKIVAVLVEDEPGDDTLGVAHKADLRVDDFEKELGFRLSEKIEGGALREEGREVRPGRAARAWR